jgi:hypothetical protein
MSARSYGLEYRSGCRFSSETSGDASDSGSSNAGSPPSEKIEYKRNFPQNAIDPRLAHKIEQLPKLREPVHKTLKELGKQFGEDSVIAYLEYDGENEEYEHTVIEIQVGYETVEEYSQIKGELREIVRANETEDVDLYSAIKRE